MYLVLASRNKQLSNNGPRSALHFVLRRHLDFIVRGLSTDNDCMRSNALDRVVRLLPRTRAVLLIWTTLDKTGCRGRNLSLDIVSPRNG